MNKLQKKQLKLFRNFKLGIELEMIVPSTKDEFLRTSIVNKRNIPYAVGTDGSVSGTGYGREIRTKKGGIRLQKFNETLPNLIKVLHESNCFVNESCGYHVHISHKQFKNPLFIKRLTHFWSAIEDVLLATQPSVRLNKHHCQRYIRQFITDIENGIVLKRDTRISVGSHVGSQGRYFTLNFNALAEHGTLEVRMHSGTTNKQKITNWVLLLLYIYSYCINRYNHVQVMELFSMKIGEEKINKVFTLLRLPKHIQVFYTNRINKFVFKTLEMQQASLHSAYVGLMKQQKERKIYDKAVQRWDKYRNSFNSDKSIMNQTFIK